MYYPLIGEALLSSNTVILLGYIICWTVLILLVLLGLYNILKSRKITREFRDRQANIDRVARLLADIEDLLTEPQHETLASFIVLYGRPYLIGQSLYKQGKLTFQQFFALNYESYVKSIGESGMNADLNSILFMATKHSAI